MTQLTIPCPHRTVRYIPSHPRNAPMQRREVVRFLGAALALPFLPSNADAAIRLGKDIHRRLREGSFRTLNRDQQALVTDIAEMIIPETDTPGAQSVKVPEFIDLILTEWADETEKSGF